jgi:hypothetical protein
MIIYHKNIDIWNGGDYFLSPTVNLKNSYVLYINILPLWFQEIYYYNVYK